MNKFARFALAIALVLALVGLASAQMPKAVHRVTPHPGLDQQSAPTADGQSQWSPLNNQLCTGNNPCFPAGVTMLLSDGTVIVHEEQDGGEQNWYKLTPDAFGSYVNGTWSQVASIPPSLSYAPLYFGSQVIADGRLTVIGGEYNFDQPVWTTQGAIYDPVANAWTNVPPPSGWVRTGDAQAVNLADGTYMQSSCCDRPPKWAYLDPTTLTWTNFQGNGKFDVFDEEGWNMLPNGKILTVDAYVFAYDPTGTNSELYDPSSQTWSSAGSTVVQIWDSGCGVRGNAIFEVGPAVLRPDGTVFQTGANTCGTGHTAIFDSHTNAWSAGPDFPVSDVSIADGAASIEPNGKVLMMGSVNEGPPATFFEWDGASLSVVPGPPNAPFDGSFYGHMLPLPTGQILYTDWSFPTVTGAPNADVEIYTPTGTYNPAWAPKILSVPKEIRTGGTSTLFGLRFSGMSQGGAYGDDYQPNTNYALVRLTNKKTGHVFYCRTHNPSSYVVQSNELEYTLFDVPVEAETGPSTLVAVTNGIPSEPIKVNVKKASKTE